MADVLKLGIGHALVLALALVLVLPTAAHAASGAASAPPAVPNGFNGTAYLKTRQTVLLDNKPYGLARAGAQLLVDQCNGFRNAYYGLPPVAPPDTVMAALDINEQEKFIAGDKALTLITGSVLVLTDMPRWMKDLQSAAASGGKPEVPVNCAAYQLVPNRHGTLWRDGKAYELRFDSKKAIGRRAVATRAPYREAIGFDRLPVETRMGEHCREVTGLADVPGSHACVWDLFPYVSYLNWPYALSGRTQFGPQRGMVETIEPVAVEHGREIPASTFEIPEGFEVLQH